MNSAHVLRAPHSPELRAALRQPARPELRKARERARRSRGLSQLHEAGREAYFAGVRLDECPLHEWQAGRASWLAGWHAAAAERVEVDEAQIPF